MTVSEVEILLVEDNPRDAELTMRTLKGHRLANHLVHVKDGQEALDWLFHVSPESPVNLTRCPKVILLDLKLPKVSGLDVLRAIRTDERTRLLPVVVLTSSRQESDVIESYNLGVNSYIVKPVDFENFSAAVAELGHYWMLTNELPQRG
ncbi:MAG TPA: response regulator [Candidatus Angelobacter sp.]|nr:response regulator [Candidatus Angelobacter sp.]